jgi:hypothetical protein
VRLGKRSARKRTRARGQLIPLAVGLAAALGPAARADSMTVGPARIVCNSTFCEMGSGARPQERVRVIVSDLPQDEIHRLRKCTGVTKPCIVTVEGTQQDGPKRIMASSIKWQD